MLHIYIHTSTRSLTPSTTFWTRATSEKPSLSELEMSNVPSVLAVSTPPVGWVLMEGSYRKDLEWYMSIEKALVSRPTKPPTFTCASLLETEGLEDVPESTVIAEFGQFHVHTSSQSRSKVWRARQDESQVFIPHKLLAWVGKKGRETSWKPVINGIIYVSISMECLCLKRVIPGHEIHLIRK